MVMTDTKRLFFCISNIRKTSLSSERMYALPAELLGPSATRNQKHSTRETQGCFFCKAVTG